MRIYRMSDTEIDSLKIPLTEYEKKEQFVSLKKKIEGEFGNNAYKYLKIALVLYTLIDLYSLTTSEKKNTIVKYLEKTGMKQENISKIDNLLRMGLSAGYITFYLLKKNQEKQMKQQEQQQEEEVKK